MKVYLLCVLALVVLLLPSEGDAECCSALHYDGTRKYICRDVTGPTPCCANGSCNIVCCNCDGGCRGSSALERFLGEEPEMEPASTAHDVIRAADQDGDGLLSVDEAHDYVASIGVPSNRARRSLMAMDLDNDDFLSAKEMDPNGSYHQ